jgi:hypothetical protein
MTCAAEPAPMPAPEATHEKESMAELTREAGQAAMPMHVVTRESELMVDPPCV